MSQPDSKADAARGVYVEKPRANIYTMLLVLSFLAICAACLCLHGELSAYNYDTKAQGAKVAP